MWRRNYRRYNYKRRNSDDALEGLLDIIFTVYILYLGTQFFIDKGNFWRWVIYGFAALIFLVGILFAIDKLRRRSSSRRIYLPYRRYFKH